MGTQTVSMLGKLVLGSIREGRRCPGRKGHEEKGPFIDERTDGVQGNPPVRDPVRDQVLVSGSW